MARPTAKRNPELSIVGSSASDTSSSRVLSAVQVERRTPSSSQQCVGEFLHVDCTRFFGVSCSYDVAIWVRRDRQLIVERHWTVALPSSMGRRAVVVDLRCRGVGIGPASTVRRVRVATVRAHTVNAADAAAGAAAPTAVVSFLMLSVSVGV